MTSAITGMAGFDSSTRSMIQYFVHWVSRLYPMKRALPAERRLTTIPWAKEVFALITSKEQGFRFCGMIELPVQWRSLNLTILNSRVDKRIKVWAMVER